MLHKKRIVMICCALCVLFLFTACEKEPPPQEKPKVISKKMPAMPPGMKPIQIQTADQGTDQPSEPTIVVAKIQPPVDTTGTAQVVSKKIEPPPTTIIPSDAQSTPANVPALTVKPDEKPLPDTTQPIEIKVAIGTPSPVQPESTETKPLVISSTDAEIGKPQTAQPQTAQPQTAQPATAETPASTITQEIITADLKLGYDATGKLDPFAPLFTDEPEKASKEEEEKFEPDKPKPIRRIRRTPLEKLDLSQLKLVGIIRASNGNRAMVEESTGKGYIIREGTYIGIHYGKVTEIMDDRIVVEEEDEDFLGQITMRQRELKIQKPLGEEYHEL